MPSHPPLLHENYDAIADALTGTGFVIIDGAFPAQVINGLVELISSKEAELKPAGIGREAGFQLNQSVRGDAIEWLEPVEPAVTEFLSAMDKLREALNQRLYLGLSVYEAHFARFAPGTFYKKHLDAFRGAPSRKLSTVLYLNPGWDQLAGGELVLYDEAGELELVRLAPECGRLVVFLSEDFPHEVLPASQPRKSIAGWFRIKPLSDFIK